MISGRRKLTRSGLLKITSHSQLREPLLGMLMDLLTDFNGGKLLAPVKEVSLPQR